MSTLANQYPCGGCESWSGSGSSWGHLPSPSCPSQMSDGREEQTLKEGTGFYFPEHRWIRHTTSLCSDGDNIHSLRLLVATLFVLLVQ